MSRYAWEHGTITLPSKEVTAFRKAIREVWNVRHDRIREEARKFWQQHKTQSEDKYSQRVQEFCNRLPKDLSWQVYTILDHILWQKKTGKIPALRQVQVKDLEQIGLGRATSSTTVFDLGEASITFGSGQRRSQVTWDVPENNHAPEDAREHPVAKEFFRLLERVQWTSRSGGTIVGNDEYNEDSYDEGGGANYVVREYSKKSQQQRLKSYPYAHMYRWN